MGPSGGLPCHQPCGLTTLRLLRMCREEAKQSVVDAASSSFEMYRAGQSRQSSGRASVKQGQLEAELWAKNSLARATRRGVAGPGRTHATLTRSRPSASTNTNAVPCLLSLSALCCPVTAERGASVKTAQLINLVNIPRRLSQSHCNIVYLLFLRRLNSALARRPVQLPSGAVTCFLGHSRSDNLG